MHTLSKLLCIQRHLAQIYWHKMLAWICIHFASMYTSQILCYQHGRRWPSSLFNSPPPLLQSCCPTKSLLYLPLFSWLLPVPLSLALRITSIRKRPHSIYYYSVFFLSLASVPRTIPEPLEPINVQTDVQRRELSFTAGSSSQNLISSTELHFRHHCPIPAALPSDHERADGFA